MRAVWVATLWSGALASGCGARDCAALQVADERDWCYHGQAIDLAKDKRTEEAIAALSSIQAPMVRSFATEKILTDASSGFTQQQAEGLCKALVEPYGTSCMRAWSRPHLWKTP